MLTRPRASIGFHEERVASEVKIRQIVKEDVPRTSDVRISTKSDGATQKRDHSDSQLFTPERVSVFEVYKKVSDPESEMEIQLDQMPMTYESMIQQ